MRRKALAGAAVWIFLAAASQLQWIRLAIIELLFLLGPLVVVPLGLGLAAESMAEKRIVFLTWLAGMLQFPAAMFAAASFWLPPGKAAAVVALPWLAYGCLIGLCGFVSMLRGGFSKLETACVTTSFFYLPVGCAWFIASRLGFTPMGFQEPIVLLTAVHFHLAGFAAPLLAMAGASVAETRSVATQKLFRVVAIGVLAGPGLLAAGFVIGPACKLAMACLVACSAIGLSLFFLAGIRTLRPRLTQVLVAASAVSVLFAMTLAAIWAIGEFPLQPFIHLEEMARIHGTANAFGFVLCGLVGWTVAGPHGPSLNRGPK
jgi:hypothetical protein